MYLSSNNTPGESHSREPLQGHTKDTKPTIRYKLVLESTGNLKELGIEHNSRLFPVAMEARREDNDPRDTEAIVVLLSLAR